MASTRARVICHMYTTIDGKIVEKEGYPDDERCEAAGDLYDSLTRSMGKAWGCGRATFQTDYRPDTEGLDISSVSYTDHPVKAESLCFAFDRFGKLFWETPFNPYGGFDSRVVEVLTEKVSPQFLAYLDSLGISYIFCGKEDLDLELFLEKVKSLFGVDTFVLCGGAEINAEFMRRGLVDEISLVVCPGVQGGRNELTFVGSNDTEGFPTYFDLVKAETLPDSVLHLVYTKR